MKEHTIILIGGLVVVKASSKTSMFIPIVFISEYSYCSRQ